MIMLEPNHKHGVRLAVQEDEDALLSMLRQMHPEAAMRSPDGLPIIPDEDLVRGEIQRATVRNRNHPDANTAWIGIVGNRPCLQGSIYLSLEKLWYSHQPVLIERWLYVTPESRRSPIAANLIDFAKKAADAAKITLIIGHGSQGREEAKARFYRRHLGNPIGSYFVHQGGNDSCTDSGASA